jgi:hypothetical protein
VDLILTESTLGTIAVILFQYKNPQKTLLQWVSVFVIGIFASKILLYLSNYFGQALWTIATIGLLSTYSLRFREKESKNPIDYLKWAGLILLVLYPLASYYFKAFGAVALLFTLSGLAIPVLGTIYMYDRWILKPEKMKRKYVITLTVQTFLILLMLTYSFIQKTEADRSLQMAVEQQKIAIEMRIKYETLVKENAR